MGKEAISMERKPYQKDMLSAIQWHVQRGNINKDTAMWVSHLGRVPTGRTRTYGFDSAAHDNFFSTFMDLSLMYKVSEMTFDTAGWNGRVTFVNFYLVELEPGEDTNITGELLEMIAKGWGLET